MGELVIRNIDDEVIKYLQFQADAKRQSLEQVLREIVIKATQSSIYPKTMASTVDHMVMTADKIASMGAERVDVDVVAMIREDRDMR